MLSGLSSYLFGTPAEEDHPAAATESAAALAEAAKTHRFRTKSAEYDWTIVDRSSRGASPDGMTEHPLENLLIEHPSMSVYKRGRDSEADTAGESDECDVTATASLPANMVAGSRRPGSRQLATTSQSRAQFARRVQYAFTDINSRQVKAVQSSRKRKEAKNFARNQVHRSNKVQQYNSSNKSSKRKQHMARMHSGKNNDRKCQY